MKKSKKYFKFPIKVTIPAGEPVPLSPAEIEYNLKRDKTMQLGAFFISRMNLQRGKPKSKTELVVEKVAEKDFQEENI